MNLLDAFLWLLSVSSVVAIGLVFKNLDKATLLFWKTLSTVVGFFRKKAAAKHVEIEATNFVNKKLFSHSADAPEISVKVSWVTQVEDARLHTDGKLIVRMRRDVDDARNTLSAVWLAARHALWPSARPWLDSRMVTAIDLQILRMLSNLLGKSARLQYTAEILTPQTQNDPELAPLLRQVYEIEQGGLFKAVLLQELLALNELLEHQPPDGDLRAEGLDFLQWIHSRAVRPPGDESTDLAFYGNFIKIAIVLLAKKSTAAFGTYPYERRLGMAILRGAQSIYVVGVTPGQSDWCKEVTSAFESDPRVRMKTNTLITRHRDGKDEQLPFVHFSRNEMAIVHGSYAEQLAALGITPGGRVPADVRSVSENKILCLVEASLDGRIHGRDLAWGYHGSPARFAAVGATVECEVSSIDEENNLLHLSRKALYPSPWQDGVIPAVGTVCDVRLEENVGAGWVVRPILDAVGPQPEFYALIPHSEWSWFSEGADQYVAPVAGAVHRAKLIVADPRHDNIVFSRQILEVRDFVEARRKYPNNTVVVAKVVRVEPQGLVLELEAGVFGRIPEYKIQRAGFELRDYLINVVPGQRFSCVVVGAKNNRGYFQLDLERNVSVPKGSVLARDEQNQSADKPGRQHHSTGGLQP